TLHGHRWRGCLHARTCASTCDGHEGEPQAGLSATSVTALGGPAYWQDSVSRSSDRFSATGRIVDSFKAGVGAPFHFGSRLGGDRTMVPRSVIPIAVAFAVSAI